MTLTDCVQWLVSYNITVHKQFILDHITIVVYHLLRELLTANMFAIMIEVNLYSYIMMRPFQNFHCYNSIFGPNIKQFQITQVSV